VATGTDNVVRDAVRRRGVILTNTPDPVVDATADLTMALLLGVTRRVGEGDRLLRTGTRWSWSMSFMLGTGLQGKRLGLVGFGKIGQAVARRGVVFGMRVAYTARHERPDGGGVGAVRLPLPELLATSDVVSLHCPLTPETRHLIAGEGRRAVRPGRSGRARGAARRPLPELLAPSDVVSLHCPLTPETRHLIDGEALRAMRPD